jgi:hypothetical protein
MATWTDILSGGPINPAHTLIKSYTPTSNLALSWPTDIADDANVMGDIVELIPAGANLAITLPDATKGSEGGASLFINKGNQTIALKNAAGVAVGLIEPGKAYFVYLAVGTTIGGTWTLFTFAAGSSIAQAAQLASTSITARGNTLVQAAPVSSLNSDYTIGTSDQASVMNWVGGVGTFTLAEAGALGQGWFCHVRNSGTGAVTVGVTAGSGNTIDGAVQIQFNPGESAILICDGLKFITISKSTTANTIFSYTSIDVSGSGNYAITQAQVGYNVYRFVGVLTGNRTITFPTTLAQFTVRNETTGAFTLTVKTSAGAGTVVGTNEAKIVYCDGSDIKPSSTAGIAFPIAITQGGTGGIDADSALTNLGGSSIGKGLFRAASAAAARAALAFGSLGDAIANAVATLLLPSGTAAAPMYSFSADPDTGIWSRGANDLGFGIGGVDRFSFQATGAYYWNGSTYNQLYHQGNLSLNQLSLAIGYTPVQQGSGVGQTGNAVKIGHSAIGPKLTVDTTDFGRLWTDVGGGALYNPVGNGYIKFPNGLILQWGTTGAGSTSSESGVALPIAFPNVFASIVVTPGGSGSALPRFANADIQTLGSFNYRSWTDAGGGSSASCHYLAIGW